MRKVLLGFAVFWLVLALIFLSAIYDPFGIITIENINNYISVRVGFWSCLILANIYNLGAMIVRLMDKDD